MNIEETKKAIEVMQAYVDGKEIEVFSGGSWIPLTEASWAWSSTWYRIKPAEPKKVKLLAFIEAEYGSLAWYLEGTRGIKDTWIRIPSEDKEVELP